MTLSIRSTSKIVLLGNAQSRDTVPARIWEGMTSTGIKVHCFIARVVVDKDEGRIEEFQRELQECAPPSTEISTYPLRLIL